MKIPRRKLLQQAAGAVALTTVPHFAFAQAYPIRPVRWIVAVAPGGGNDVFARLMGQWLSVRLGQPFIVENRPGAGTNIGTEVVVKAPPDGYTLLLASSNNASNAALYDNLNFDFIRDIAPVAGIARTTLVMVVNPSVPAKTIPEFVAYAKANPGKVNMASAGTGGIGHLAGELLKMAAGVDLVHVPYRGNGPALRRPGQITASPSCPEIANGGYSECERRFSYSSGCPYRFARRRGGCPVSFLCFVDRVHQSGQVARPRGNQRDALGRGAGSSERR